MGHRGEAPESHGYRITCSRTEAVNEASDEQHACRIGDLEVRNEMAILDVVPTEVVLQRGLQNAEQLAIHVIFRDAEKKESADHPAKGADGSRIGCGGPFGCLRRIEIGGGGERGVGRDGVCWLHFM